MDLAEQQVHANPTFPLITMRIRIGCVPVSVRVYTGPHADRRRGSADWPRLLPGALAAATVGLQIAWPLTAGATRDLITVLTVVAFVLACAAHASAVRGLRWMFGWLLLSSGIGLLAEAVGTRTGLPFGDYSYADRLGPAIAGVPVVVALAWSMMSYPCLLAARRLSAHPLATAAFGALLLTAWDLFLDPQMVAAGHWTWADPDPHLPGIDAVPASNFVGWLLVAVVLMLLLDRLPRRRSDGAVPPDTVPAVLLGWTYASSVLLNLAFDHRPGVALWGGIAMGALVIPYLVMARVDRP